MDDAWIESVKGKKGVNARQALKDLREYARNYKPKN